MPLSFNPSYPIISGSGMIPWKLQSSDYTAKAGDRILIDTIINPWTLTLPKAETGDEIDLFAVRLVQKLNINLNGTKFQGKVPTALKFKNEYVKFIYIDADLGWLAINLNGLEVFYESQLLLPQLGLKDFFYAHNLQQEDNSLVPIWAKARQGDVAKQPVFKKNIFAENTIPSVFFNGDSFLNIDLTYLGQTKYAIVVVEARTSAKSNNYFLGNDTVYGDGDNQNLHLGYKFDTELKFGQYANDLPLPLPGYSGFSPQIWIFNNNSAGHAIWRNSKKEAFNTNTQNLIAGHPGVIGKRHFESDTYIGHLGLIAIYTGDKSDIEIQEIFNAVNTIFKIY